MTSEEVVQHYNAGLDGRTESRIFYLRNFNNWVKSMLINDFTDRLSRLGCRSPRVLDFCCGKGGDLRKWSIARASSVVMSDIADVSLKQAQERYEEMKSQQTNRGHGGHLFDAQFVLADLGKDDLREMLTARSADKPFDLVSCQFSLHYNFSDEERAKMVLKNAVGMLRPGGFFIGTLPDADAIVAAARRSPNAHFENSVCSVRFEDPSEAQGQPPLFGCKFHFTLDEQVNCPEFLCHFPLLKHMLETEHDMELIYEYNFADASRQFLYADARNGARRLLGRMQALESYPSAPGARLLGDPDKDYEHAKKADDGNQSGNTREQSVGLLSQPEHQVAALYLVFAFRKKGEFANTTTEPRKRAADTDDSAESKRPTDRRADDDADAPPPPAKKPTLDSVDGGDAKEPGEDGGANDEATA